MNMRLRTKHGFLLLLAGLLFLSGCAAETPVGDVAAYGQYRAELLDADFFADDDGKRMVTINMRYSNDGTEALYLLESFVVKAYQGDVALSDRTDINEEEALIQEVKDGGSLEAGYTFELASDEAVMVKIYTPTAEEKLLAQKEYACDG